MKPKYVKGKCASFFNNNSHSFLDLYSAGKKRQQQCIIVCSVQGRRGAIQRHPSTGAFFRRGGERGSETNEHQRTVPFYSLCSTERGPFWRPLLSRKKTFLHINSNLFGKKEEGASEAIAGGGKKNSICVRSAFAATKANLTQRGEKLLN